MLTIAGALLAGFLALAIIPREGSAPFPLHAGNYWVYQGSTRWTVPNSSKVEERSLTWKMEVIRTLRRGTVEGALIKGHPSDLAWYEEGKEPGEYIILRKEGVKYYLLDGERKDEAVAWLDGKVAGSGLPLDEWDLFLQLPLAKGKSFGGEKGHDGGEYSWLVADHGRADLAGVKGLDPKQSWSAYTLTMMTGPDDLLTEFVPDIGITRFRYRHHGTISETDLRLVECKLGYQ